MASTLKDAKAAYLAQGCCKAYSYKRCLNNALNGKFCPEASKLLNPTGDPDGLRCKPVFWEEMSSEGEVTEDLVLAVVSGQGGTANSNSKDVELRIAAAAQAGERG